jgi:hypothetical protein
LPGVRRAWAAQAEAVKTKVIEGPYPLSSLALQIHVELDHLAGHYILDVQILPAGSDFAACIFYE